MKLFIKNYNPINILKKQKILDEFYFSKKNNIEIISDDGIFYIDNKYNLSQYQTSLLVSNIIFLFIFANVLTALFTSIIVL